MGNQQGKSRKGKSKSNMSDPVEDGYDTGVPPVDPGERGDDDGPKTMPSIRATIFASPLKLSGRFDLDSMDTDDVWEPPVFEKSPAERAFLQEVLQKNFIFMDLNASEKEIFLQAMEPETVKDGHVIIEQGATTGDFYYYIVDLGKVNFFLQTDSENKLVGSCERGGSFGELALLYNSPRAVSCIAASETVRLWKVDQKTFRRVLAKQAASERHCVTEWIKQVELFKNHLDEAAVQRFVQSMTVVHWKEGDVIVKKGDVGKTFYLIQSGTAKVSDIGLGDSQQQDQILGEGHWFGERALLTGEARAANVTALTHMTTFAMDAETFEECIGPLQGIFEKEMRKDSLKSIPIFANSVSSAEVASASTRGPSGSLKRSKDAKMSSRSVVGVAVDTTKGVGGITKFELDQMANLMKDRKYKKGDVLVEAGKPAAPNMWIIRSGRVTVTRPSLSTETIPEKKRIINLQSGDYFGDNFVRYRIGISHQTAVCDEDCVAWIITRDEIESVIGTIERLGEIVGEDDEGSGRGRDDKMEIEKAISLSDLTKHRVLGCGAFGKVWLVSHKEHKTTYALKAMNKVKLIESKQYEGVIREKDFLALLQHPFILHLVAPLQDEHYLYLLLPLVPGGELFSVLHKRKQNNSRGLVNNEASFYAACVIEALGHFHQRNIAYRDLKLENILIDERGYCKVVDLGFAKVVPEKTYTLVGTPEYLAPEIIMSKGYDKAVDYWAFGILCFELLVGHSPFYIRGSSTIDMFKRIVMVNYRIPTFVDSEANAMISKLLLRAQAKRLGNLSRGYLDIKGHPWFERSGINFVDVLKLEAKAPWTPTVKDAFDSSNFDDFSAQEREEEELEELTEKEKELFKDF